MSNFKMAALGALLVSEHNNFSNSESPCCFNVFYFSFLCHVALMAHLVLVNLNYGS